MPPAENPPAISMRAVELRRGGRTLLGPLDWEVGSAQRWVVMGPNGSGKTTLMRLASMREHPSAGEVAVLGSTLGRCDVRELRRRVGFACPALIAEARPSLTAHDFVMAARRGALDVWWHRYDEADAAAALAALGDAGIAGLAEAPLASLSSGESQRAQLARALVAAPELLILDEPSAGLDLGGRESVIDVIDRRLAPRVPVVLVTHHLEEIPTSITHAMVLRDGAALAAGPVAEVLTSGVLSESFGVALSVGRDAGRWTARRH